MKIREIYIENYKMFRDFKIDFLDSNNQPLDIVVLAGVNGSGKTTLLECLSMNLEIKQDITTRSVGDSIINIEIYKSYSSYLAQFNDEDFIKEFSLERNYPSTEEWEQIIHLPVYQNNIQDLKETIRQKYIDRAFEIDKPSKALEELQTFISDIFQGLDLSFNLASIDYNKNIVLFKDNNGNEFDIEELSTGEKTLLSKVLYLYFKDYKDKVILIDEPELSLHPSWQNRVLKIYENFAALNNCQIIIATHSPHIIRSAENESLRILHKNSEGQIEVIKGLKAHGRDINSVLFDVMGEVEYRPKSFRDKIDRLHIAIDDKKFEEATVQLNELKKDYGENDAVIIEAQMLIDVMSTQE
ncbi:MAG: AAA family ATPase [Campylobacterales bacterium]|nr:AAA family ATPase [Campylobacterales bacterium]